MKERHLDEDRYLNEVYGEYSIHEIEELLGVEWAKIVDMFDGMNYRQILDTLDHAYPTFDNRPLAFDICNLLEYTQEE